MPENSLCRLFLRLCGLLVLGPVQNRGCTARKKSPELKLRIITDKETYVLHESVFARTEITNLTPNTLCFPEPDQECTDSARGSLSTTGEAVDTGKGEKFICHLDGGIWQRDTLVSEIDEHWIKLAPNQTYVTKPTGANVNFSLPGQWKLTSTYRPPEGAFRPAEYRRELQAAAEKVGCAVPKGRPVADSKVVTVIAEQNK